MAAAELRSARLKAERVRVPPAQHGGTPGSTRGTPTSRVADVHAHAHLAAQEELPKGLYGFELSPPPDKFRQRGTLVVDVLPLAHVYIDGREAGRTTTFKQFSVSVAPGPHDVRLETDKGQVHTTRIEVLKGETVVVRHRFAESDPVKISAKPF
jgi:hypothetical protein